MYRINHRVLSLTYEIKNARNNIIQHIILHCTSYSTTNYMCFNFERDNRYGNNTFRHQPSLTFKFLFKRRDLYIIVKLNYELVLL